MRPKEAFSRPGVIASELAEANSRSGAIPITRGVDV